MECTPHIYLLLYFLCRTSNPNPLSNPLSVLFTEYVSCLEHRSIILTLCATLQIITIRCPAALVWNNLGDGKTSCNFLCGSPLDLLGCGTSSLPMPPNPHNQLVKKIYFLFTSLNVQAVKLGGSLGKFQSQMCHRKRKKTQKTYY